MLFASYLFILGFLPLTLAGFALARLVAPAAAKLWLIAASLVFYGWWNPVFVPILLGSAVANVTITRVLQRETLVPLLRRVVLLGALAANLGLLVWYRYLSDWLTWFDLNFQTGIRIDSPLVPLGISFFTFTQIGYLLDCHAGTEPRRQLLDHLLFVVFFPSLIAGPILSGPAMLPQIAGLGRRPLQSGDLAVGSAIFIIGLLKKAVLADPLVETVAAGFGHPETLTLLPAWQTAMAYSLQLYFDFSGYSDMAVGLGRLFGLTLPWNFASPYRARNVIEYWQRWHISLTKFFMASLHAPLTMAVLRRRRARGLRSDRAAQRSLSGFLSMLALPLMATMGLAGIWHGAGMTFLVFGLLHGAYLMVNHGWRLLRPPSPTPRWYVTLGNIGLTYFCVLIGSVFFRAPTLESALGLLAGMTGLHGTAIALNAHMLSSWLSLGVLYAIVWFAPNTQAIMAIERPAAWAWRPHPGWAVAMGSAAAIGLLSLGGGAEFLYFQF